ncbi:MAG TPA: hypothetical protein PLG90_10480 [Ignavibacteria bacterium]|nr:hypothetical protein [Ignavibacteria bacterium]
MLKLIFLIYLYFCVNPILYSQDLFMSYEKTGTIYKYNLNTNEDIKLFEGYQQSISPDGKKIAYTESDEKTGGRFISIYDIESKTVKRMTSVPGDNSYFPRYSPDGNYLVFNHWTNNNWQIAIVSVDDRNFKILTENKIRNLNSFYSPSWTEDSKSIITHDMSNIIEFSIEGEVLNIYPLDKIDPSKKIFFSSASTVWFDKTNFALIFDCEVDNEFGGTYENQNRIYRYDLLKNVITKISPDEYSATNPFISFSSGKIFFNAFTKEDVIKKIEGEMEYFELTYSIYNTDIKGDKFSFVLKNGTSPSLNK